MPNNQLNQTSQFLTGFVQLLMATVGVGLFFVSLIILKYSTSELKALVLILLLPFSLVLTVLGVTRFVGYMKACRRRERASAIGHEVTAVITELKPQKFGQPPFYTYTVEFELNGRKYRLSDPYMARPEVPCQVGSIVKVKVVPTETHVFVILCDSET